MKVLLNFPQEHNIRVSLFTLLNVFMINSLKSTKRGFTLIELLVVIAIIGILSSVVLASLSTAREKSRDARRISDIGQLQLALELVFDLKQGYPNASGTGAGPGAAGDNYVPCTLGPTTATNCFKSSTAAAISTTGFGYMPKIPSGPQNDRYFYVGTVSGGGECTNLAYQCYGYVLAANLENTTNVALQSDADRDVGTVLYGAPNHTDCTTAAAGPEKCYDIAP